MRILAIFTLNTKLNSGLITFFPSPDSPQVSSMLTVDSLFQDSSATTMNILLLAPHPFYQERGTPIAVDLLLRALVKRGDSVDVLTYHEGEDLEYGDNVRILRIPQPPCAKNIRPGFTLKKLICDAYMRPKALALAGETKYDIVHAVEESVFIAMAIQRKYGIPYIFDMDSSMPEQIADKLFFMRPLLPLMRSFERRAVRKALAVVPMCDSLGDMASQYGARKVVPLRDISLLGTQSSDVRCQASGIPPSLYELRRAGRDELGIEGICFMYIGNLEKYQGIDLLLESFARFQKSGQKGSLVIVGGIERDIVSCKAHATELGIEDCTHFTGPRPLSAMKSLFAHADILVSPRAQGENTPMKIYSYLDSGKPILATDLPTHTQVLSKDVAELVAPDAEDFSAGMIRLAEDSDRRDALAKKAKILAQEKYSISAFETQVDELYGWIDQHVSDR